MTTKKPKAQPDQASIDDAAAADAEAKAKADAAEAQAAADAEMKAKADVEAQASADAEAKAKADAEAQAQQDLEHMRAEAEHIRDGGIDFAIEQLAMVLGVDAAAVNWDAATETEEGDVRAVLGNVLTARFGESWPDVPMGGEIPEALQISPVADPNALDAAAEAARAAGEVTEARPLKAQTLIDWVQYIEPYNNDTLRPELLQALEEEGFQVEALEGERARFRLVIAGLEIESGPGLEIALRSWCETARVAVLRGEAV